MSGLLLQFCHNHDYNDLLKVYQTTKGSTDVHRFSTKCLAIPKCLDYLFCRGESQCYIISYLLLNSLFSLSLSLSRPVVFVSLLFLILIYFLTYFTNLVRCFFTE